MNPAGDRQWACGGPCRLSGHGKRERDGNGEGPALFAAGEGGRRLSTLDDLTALADWARCGKGSETVLDLSARRTRRIGPDGVRVAWAGLEAAVAEAQRALCPHWQLQADLHDVLIYGAGDKFRPHRDARKFPKHVATLVVAVGGIAGAGAAVGGDVVLTDPHVVFPRGGRRSAGTAAAVEPAAWTWRSSTAGGAWCAWFIEVEHEVTEVAAGHRVVAVYNLSVAGAALPSVGQITAEARAGAGAEGGGASRFPELPPEVLREFVAPYLDAPTAQALRLTCRAAAAAVVDREALLAAALIDRGYVLRWLTAAAWGNCHSVCFVAAYNYSFDGRPRLDGDEEALGILRGADRSKALAIREAFRRYSLCANANGIDKKKRRLLSPPVPPPSLTRFETAVTVVPVLGRFECPERNERGTALAFSPVGSFYYDRRVQGYHYDDDFDTCLVSAEGGRRPTVVGGSDTSDEEDSEGGREEEEEEEAEGEGDVTVVSTKEDEVPVVVRSLGRQIALPPFEKWDYSDYVTEYDGSSPRSVCLHGLSHAIPIHPDSSDGNNGRGGIDVTRIAPCKEEVCSTENLWGNAAVFSAYTYRKAMVMIRFVPVKEGAD